MTRNSIWISTLAAAVVIGGLAYWTLRGDEAVVTTPTPQANKRNRAPNTVAEEWQWRNFDDSDSLAKDKDKAAPTAAVPAQAVAIYRILQSIKLDENGRVVPDQTMKDALEEGFEELGPDLVGAQMSELQKSISTGLPGRAGEEAAQILENYYRFRLAETEFERQQSNETPADHYERLVQLRRSHLGAETADKLFAVEDVTARDMFAAIEIQLNANLTDQEKEAQLSALQDKRSERLLTMGLLQPEEVAAEKVERMREQGASNEAIYSTRKTLLSAESARDLAASDREEAAWQRRFNGFWQARRYITQAGLDEGERERQIEQLLEQYFSPEERERARVTSSNWQARDAQ